MNSFTKNTKLKTLMFAISMTLGISASADVKWTITDLGTLGTGRTSGAYDINNAGQVVGWSYTTIGQGGHDPYHAFLYDPKKGMTNLGTLGGSRSSAFSINDRGTAVGFAEKSPRGGSPVLFEDGSITEFKPLGSASASLRAINNANQMAGSGHVSGSDVSHAFLYLRDGTAKDLGTLGGHTSATAISDNGLIVGAGDVSIGGWQHAFLYDNNRMIDLGTLGGERSAATSVNNGGQVVGYSDIVGTSNYQAFIYQNGVMTALPSFGAYSMGLDINNKGQVVGYGYSGTGTRAYLYDKGETIDLSTLTEVTAAGWSSLIEARAINDNGDIVGTGITRSGARHAFLLTAHGRVPVPATYLLMLGGLGLMGFMRRKKI